MAELTERQVFFLGLKALGNISEGGLQGQVDAIRDLKFLLDKKLADAENKLRVEIAHKTAHKRIARDHPRWGVHMRHCYSLDYDDFYGEDEEPTSRHTCKYGEDDICPAALHEDPWAVYCEAFPDN